MTAAPPPMIVPSSSLATVPAAHEAARPDATCSFPGILATLATLLDYPANPLGPDRPLPFNRDTAPGPDNVQAALGRFLEGMSALPVEAREELYTATFDVSPACVPYVSIHLFGEENFKRGEFMAALRARYSDAGFDPRGELPDHLSVLLRFAAGTGDDERRELAEFCLLGPVGRMIDSLGGANPYRALLEAIRAALEAGHPGLKAAVSPLESARRTGHSCAPAGGGCSCSAAPIQDGPGDSPDDGFARALHGTQATPRVL